jgi:hypothetical protein
MKKATTILICSAVGAVMFFAGRGCGRSSGGGEGGNVLAETRVDTLWVRDTVSDTVRVPVERLIVRVDTVFVPSARDTTHVEVALPIERQVFATSDYRAVVEGFRPSLVELEFYRRSALVTRQTTIIPPPRRWSAGVQAGWGITPRGFAPYLGVGIQYRLAEW